METAAIGIDAPAKGQIGAVIATQNLPARVVKDLHYCRGGRLEQFTMRRFKWIWRIGDHTHSVIVATRIAIVNPRESTPQLHRTLHHPFR
jgi:hypothetical protein